MRKVVFGGGGVGLGGGDGRLGDWGWAARRVVRLRRVGGERTGRRRRVRRVGGRRRRFERCEVAIGRVLAEMVVLSKLERYCRSKACGAGVVSRLTPARSRSKIPQLALG